MNTPAIIFTKIPLGPNANKVLFCLEQNKLPEFNLAKMSPTEFAKINSLTRHDKFDWHVNKQKPICYIFEVLNTPEPSLPTCLSTFENHSTVQWFTFPQTIKSTTNGTHRNLVQLAVQYISYGMVDDSVIAADYDKEWLESLQQK